MRNSFGKTFKVTTFGESHGVALGCVIDGCPAQISLKEEDIQRELDLRKPGQSKFATPRKENDKVRILSGVFEGKTLGTPIAMIVENKDVRSEDYGNLKEVFRPGHADFTWEVKFGVRDFRGGGRSSGRETVARVMAGAVAQKILEAEKATKEKKKGGKKTSGKIKIYAFAAEIGGIAGEKVDLDYIEKNPLRAADAKKEPLMEKEISSAAREGDSVGGIVEIIIKNVPAGLGEPVFGKLSSDLAAALCSIPAVKGIEFGAGFLSTKMRGSQNNDPLTSKNGKITFTKNDAGGLLGGISTGQDIIIRIAVKPTSSISKPQKTITKQGKNTQIEVKGRHDACIVPRLVPVAKNMVAIVLADHVLMQKRNLS
ncbi:MAG: chorismate synthase [Candidatus Gracilibacteria bacterium]